VFGLDDYIAGFGDEASLLVVVAVALLLGVRHAADPDHLVAVSTLVATETRSAARRSTVLGAAWGAGHATTLALFGLPIVLLGRYLPEPLQQASEVLVGVVIAALAVRLLVLWRRGRFHAHLHAHGQLVHRHIHRHAETAAHAHEHRLLRSRRQAFALGLVHGTAGSAAVGVLLLAGIESRGVALLALGVFALGTALSMTAVSSGLGYVLGRGPLRRRIERLVPALAAVSLAFGIWYAVAAL
jgi:ABC-type nickel/cobalt efflux system permease component RcnA